MNLSKELLLVLASIAICWALNDAEIERIKKLVDQELLTREAQIAKSQQKEKKVTPTLGSSTKIKSNIKIHPDAANEPFHPLGRSTTTLPPTETKSVRPATTQVTQPPVHPQEEKLQHSIDNCIDLYETFKCQHLISIGVSCEKDELDLYCEKSCGFCGAPNPVDCLKTMYGCCDDGITPRKNPYGHGCPICKDNVPALCEPHISDCNEVGMVGNWMLANCHKTCGVCQTTTIKGTSEPKPDCQDDEQNGKFCKDWADSGLCNIIPDLMNAQCRKTCNKCGEDGSNSLFANKKKTTS